MGDQNSADEYVKKFYNSWRRFKSWKSFLHECNQAKIYDLKNAENNKEKKWMKKENDALEAPLKREEAIIVSELVENAYIRDPRITRILIKERDYHRNRRRKEREIELKKQREREERERKKREAERKRKEEIRQQELKKERALDKMRKSKVEVPKKFRLLCTEAFFEGKIKNDHVNIVCFNCSIDEIRNVLNKDDKDEQLKEMKKLIKIGKKRKKEKDKKLEAKRKKEEEIRNKLSCIILLRVYSNEL